MAQITCAACGKSIEEDDAYFSDKGSVCPECNSNLEIEASTQNRLLSVENITTLALLTGAVALNINFNGVNYGGLLMGPVALIAAAVLLAQALTGSPDPAWMRFGRPAILLIAGIVKIALTLPGVLSL